MIMLKLMFEALSNSERVGLRSPAFSRFWLTLAAQPPTNVRCFWSDSWLGVHVKVGLI